MKCKIFTLTTMIAMNNLSNDDVTGVIHRFHGLLHYLCLISKCLCDFEGYEASFTKPRTINRIAAKKEGISSPSLFLHIKPMTIILCLSYKT